MKLRFHYANQYADREAWSAYTITIPGSQKTLHGDAKRYSTLDLKLKVVISNSAARNTIELKISAEDVRNQQVEISKLFANDWVEKEVPSESKR